MIYVLGISLFITDILYLVNNKIKYEGFEDSNEPLEDSSKKDEGFEDERLDEGFEDEILDEGFEDDPVQDADKETFKHTTEFIKYDDYEYNENDDYDSKLDNKQSSDKNNNEDRDTTDNDYMHDKNILNKLKKLDPNILNTLQNMNSMNIKEINKTINQITNKQLDS